MTEALRRFIEGLDRAKPYLTTEQQTLAPGVEDIADMLWLAAELAAHTPPAEMETIETSAVEDPIAPESPDSIPPTPEVTPTSTSTVPPPQNTESLGVLSTQPPTSTPESEESSESMATNPPLPKKVERLKVPAAAALRHPLQLIRALRPLARKVDSRTEKIIDEEATAIAMAEKNPIGVVQQPAQERWLSLELVIEQSRITALWDRTSKEWADLLSGSGLFRSVRVWTVGRSEQPDLENSTPEETSIRLASGLPSSRPSRWATPKELLDPSGQSLVMVLSDCVSPRWWQGQIQPVLAEWASQEPVVVVQWFPPEPYWDRTALKLGYELQLKALAPGLPNSLLLREYQGLNPEMGLDLLEEEEPTKAVILPIVSLDPHQLGQWSRMVAGYSDAQVTGRRFDLIWQGEQWQGPR
ncbi:MAG: SAV_2336 N-terminal domain-related protein, partial [Prochlorotrichaceae cyanobacterium]